MVPISETPLAMAVEAENWPIFKILFEKRAVFHTTRLIGDLLGRSECSWGLQRRAVKNLLRAGASATTMAYGNTPRGHTTL